MVTDRIVPNLQTAALLLLCLCIPASSDESSTPHVYTRFADVERHCQSVLSSAAELRDGGADRVPYQMERLSFMNGDWSQDAGQAPLLPPFPGSHADAAIAGGPHEEQLEAVNLASFVLTHMEKAPRRGGAGTVTALNVSGVLTLAITRNCCSSSMEKEIQRARTPEFVLRPRIAKLQIQLEGVYTETGPSSGAVSDDGELVLCMVGNAVLPVRGGNGPDPWAWAMKSQRGGQMNLEAPAPVMADDNILVVLRYPETRTLTNRAVHGEMVSTTRPPISSDGAYFDKVRLVSRLHSFYYRGYQFREDLGDVTAGCSDSEQTPLSLRDDDDLYRGAFFCDILRHFAPDDHGLMDVVPNWSCNSTDPEFCSPLRQFDTSRPDAGAGGAGAMEAMAFARSAMAVQGLECVPDGIRAPGASASARVAAVFQLVPPWEHRPTAAQRTGLDGATVSAEGLWTASTGRLCMVACRGSDDDTRKEKKGKDACGHSVTMYIPTTFSITRRAIIAGQIASVDGSHAPVSFRQLVDPRYHWQHFDGRGETLRMAYDYTKIQQASDLLRRRENAPSGFHLRDSFIGKPFLSYPDLHGAADDDAASLSNLGDDLGLSFQWWSSANKPAFVPEWIEETVFELRILSLGSLVGRYDPPYQPVEFGNRFEQFSRRRRGVLNVSAQIAAPIWRFSDSRPVLSLEGVYNPADGRMHLIGCRDATHAPSRQPVSSASRDLGLEDGMDCSIEVTVEYPAITTRWLVSPVAHVRVASTRDPGGGDPLHFNVAELRSLPIFYRDQRLELAEPKVEGFLCIAILSATVAATVSQLRHVGSHPDVAPYVSLAALGVQALGYSATLVADARTLHAWPTLRYSSASADRVQRCLDCAVKALTLAALFLTARLVQKVQQARATARARSPIDPWRIPSEGLVLVRSLVAYVTGLVFVLAAHWRRTLPPAGTRTLTAVVVERCLGVAKEWFLLPQVVGNAVWRVNCKPLEARYYAGVTVVWLLPHVYGYLRPPVVNPHEAQHYAPELEFYSSRAFAVAVPVVGVVLALAVYAQQRWNYRILGRWVTKGKQNKLQHVY